MNKTIFFALAFGTAMASIACGDDTGTGGSGDTTGTGTAASTKAASVTGSGASTTKAASTGSGSSSTGAAAAPCAAACASDAGCDAMPPAPTGACETCLTDESAKGTQSTCSVAAAFDPKCQGNADCKEVVDCILAGMTQEMCATANMTGYGLLRLQVLETCAECGMGIP